MGAINSHWYGVPPSPGYIGLRQYCLRHGLYYSLLYSYLNRCKIRDYIKLNGRYFVPESMDPEQFKRDCRYGRPRAKA